MPKVKYDGSDVAVGGDDDDGDGVVYLSKLLRL